MNAYRPMLYCKYEVHSCASRKEFLFMARTKNCRSASGSGNIRKRPNGTWEGRYTAGTDERTGKSIRRSVYGKTQKEVRERLRQITNDIDTGSYVAPCSMKYSEWIDIWLSEYLTGRSPLTISQYKSYAHNHIVPVLGNHRLDELSLAQIQKFINSLAQESLSAKTVKNIYGIMHRCLQQAVTLGYLRHNPSEHCSLPRSLDPGITPLETPEIMLLIRRLQELNHPDANLILVTLFTGMRQSEVIGLSWPDVDFRKGIIFVRRQLVKLPEKGQGYIFSSPKSRKSRIIKPAQTVMRILDHQREQQKHWAQTAGSAWDNPDNLVFTNEVGRHLAHVTVYKRFKDIVRELGFPECRFHDLRHTFATVALENGDSIKTVQANLGHATASFTMAKYAHVSEVMRMESSVQMDRFIHNVSDL